MNRLDEVLEKSWNGEYGVWQFALGGVLTLPMWIALATATPSEEAFHVWTVGEFAIFMFIALTFGSGTMLLARTVIASKWNQYQKALVLATVGMVLLAISHLSG